MDIIVNHCIEFRISVLHSSFSNGVQLGKIIGTAVCFSSIAGLYSNLCFEADSLELLIRQWLSPMS